jgi:hypothetical protein
VDWETTEMDASSAPIELPKERTKNNHPYCLK